MNKKIMLLALAVASVAAYALPAMAMAEDVPLHVTPKPTVASSLKGGAATLQAVSGSKLVAKELTGTVSWESSTTGKATLTLKNDVTESIFGSSCGEIKTTELQLHLVTLPGKVPGVLITTNAGHFATFTCAGFITYVIRGNGIIGRITSPACGAESSTMVIKFEQVNGVQSQKTVEGTETEYFLETSVNGGAFEQAGLTAEGTITFPEGKKKLECT